MASLPPSPFSFADKPSAETLVVTSSPQACDVATSGPFDSGARPSPPDEAAAAQGSHAPPAAAADIDEHRFVLDEDKFMFDIGCVPSDFEKYIAMMDALVENDEPPLFLRQASA